jgi:hypothetical protein
MFTKKLTLGAQRTIVDAPRGSYVRGEAQQRANSEDKIMLKTIALVGLAVALAIPSTAAFAVSGTSSAYGTDDYEPTIPTQSLSNFDRGWNHANESKDRARASADWVRRHGSPGGYPYPHYHAQ